jgi:hypothetical protein
VPITASGSSAQAGAQHHQERGGAEHDAGSEAERRQREKDLLEGSGFARGLAAPCRLLHRALQGMRQAEQRHARSAEYRAQELGNARGAAAVAAVPRLRGHDHEPERDDPPELAAYGGARLGERVPDDRPHAGTIRAKAGTEKQKIM